MKKGLFILLIPAMFSLTSVAQKKCATQVISNRLNKIEAVQQARERLEEHTRNFKLNTRNAINAKKATVKIPVVVHILYRLESQNKSDADVQSQIDILNKDFNRLNTDANKTPAEFLGVAAAVGIEFCLAAKDTNGNATTGIVRKQVTEENIGNADTFEDKYAYEAKGGSPAWNPKKYMNIWVCEIDAAGTLGYAFFPGQSPTPETDGIVIIPGAFGSEAADDGVNLGRTTTHEVGHYFNLNHIWGDDQNETDVCSKDDGVDDTPLQGTAYQSTCFTASQFSCGSSDMFQNFMDYTNDDCMNLFTAGQKTRVIAALNSDDRKGLLAGDIGCYTLSPTGFSEVGLTDLASVYPIPATTEITVALKNNSAAVVELLDLTGTLVFANEQSQNGNISINISHLASGTYLLNIMSEGKFASTKVIIQ